MKRVSTDNSPKGATRLAKDADFLSEAVPAVRAGVRRDKLIEVAASVFAAKGYGNASIQDVADEIGLLKGSLYHYINTKEDLLYEVIRSTMVTWRDLVLEVRASNGNVIEKLRDYLTANISGSLAARERTAVFVHDFHALSVERQQSVLMLRDEHDDLLRELIAQGQIEGLIDRDLRPKITALAILTMSGSLYRWYDPHGSISGREIAEELVAFVMRGLGVKAVPSS